MAAEYIAQRGNLDVVLCERGIRTFEPATRNTLDISAVPVVQATSHLPIIVDPSHAAGRKDLVVPLSRAAIAVGADGVIVDVHPDPEAALCDGPQALLGTRAARARPGGAPAAAGRRPGGREHARPAAGRSLRRSQAQTRGWPGDRLEVSVAVLLGRLLAVHLALGGVRQEDLDRRAVGVLESDRDRVAVGTAHVRHHGRGTQVGRLGPQGDPAELEDLADVGDLARPDLDLGGQLVGGAGARQAPPRRGRTPPRRELLLRRPHRPRRAARRARPGSPGWLVTP